MRANDPELALEAAVRMRPSPAQVLSLMESHSIHACVARWGWIGREGLKKMASQGREERRAQAGVLGCRRTTPAEEEAVIAEVFRLGSVHAAAAATGRSYNTILSYLRERGIRDYPKVTHSERGRRAWQTRIARGNTGASA